MASKLSGVWISPVLCLGGPHCPHGSAQRHIILFKGAPFRFVTKTNQPRSSFLLENKLTFEF